MLTTREVIKTFYNALLQRLKKHRGDWNQNDPTADDYIKNRPFYTDENDKTVNVPEQKITILSERPEAKLVLPELIEFVTGQTYEVKWDNKTYSCVAFDRQGISAIGNQGVFDDGNDTGEPFIMMISKAHKMGVVMAIKPEAIGTHTVEVTTTKVVTLNRKYIPDLGLAPVATSGNYYDLKNAPTVYSDVVRYNAGQSLSRIQKEQARENIGAISSDEVTGVVKYTAQSLTDTQKQQARTNIGAGTSNFSGSYNDLTNKPTIPVQVQSDWSVYDDTSKSHILNRPCYDYVSYNSTSISVRKIADKCTNYNSTIGLYVGTVQTYADYKDILTLNRSNEIYALKFPNVNDPYIHFKYQKFWIALDNISGGTGTGTITIWGNPFLIYQSVQQYSTTLNKNLYLTVEDARQQKNPLTQDMLNTGEPFAFAQDSLSGTYLGISGGGLRVCSKERFSGDIVYQYIRDLKQLDEKFIPDTIARTSQIEQKVDKSELEKLNTPKDYIILIDQINGYHYIACMRNGNFVTYCATKSIEVTAMPTKTEYTTGEYFDPAGMTVVATAYDGTTKEITDFICPSSYILDNDTFIEIKYIEAGITHIATVPITVNSFNPAIILVDFDYTDNGDGTYTITGWKGTYNGEASTEIIIPNNGLIKV